MIQHPPGRLLQAKESEAAQVARREHLEKLALLTAPKAVEQLALPCSAPI